MQSTVLHNQNLFDIAIQENGNVLTVFELALLNGISITDNIEPAEKLQFVKSPLAFPELVEYLSVKEQVVATGGIDSLEVQPTGIGYMIIQNNFIVG